MKNTVTDFEIGINSFGLHLRKPGGCVCLTLIDANRNGDLTVAMSGKDMKAKERLLQSFRSLARPWGLSVEQIEDISEENTFISSSSSFVFDSIAADGISLMHIESFQTIGIENNQFQDGIPEVLVGRELNCDLAIKDFFSLCPAKIDSVRINFGYTHLLIKRRWGLKTISGKLLTGYVDNLKVAAFKKSSYQPQDISFDGDILTLKLNSFHTLLGKKYADLTSWRIYCGDEPFPLQGLIYAIEAVRRFPDIGRLYYYYNYRNHWKKVIVTQKNLNSVLKKVISKRDISPII